MIKFLINTDSVWKKVAGILLFFILFSTTLTVFSAPPTTKYLPGITLDPTCGPSDTNCTTAVAPAVVNFTTVDDSDSPYSVLSTDQVIYADTAAGDVNIVLPQISSVTESRKITVLKTSASNTVTVDAYSGDYINETTTVYLTSNRKGFIFESIRGNQWLATPNFDDLVVSPTIVRAGTAAALSGVTYDNGSSGVGATITKSTNGALPNINGISLGVGDRLLVKNQSAQTQNGVYIVTSLGSGGSPYVLTRTTDADEPSEMSPQIVIATEGGNWTIKGKQWVQETDAPVFGTSNITYTSITPSTYVTQGSVGTQLEGQVAFWTSNSGQKQLSKGEPQLFYNSTNNFLGVGTSSPDSTLDVLGDGAGTYAFRAINSTSAEGQIYLDSNGVIVASAGNGADNTDTAGTSGQDVTISTGDGGNGTAVGNTANGGYAGNLNLFAGDGGNGEEQGFIAAQGGFGGDVNILAGDGGNSTGASDTAGDGGDIYVNPGAGGTGSNAGSVGRIYLANVMGEVNIGTSIDNGNILSVGGTPSTAVAKFENTGNVAGNLGITVSAGANASDVTPTTLINFSPLGSPSIGSITFASNATSYNTTSDQRLKENIEDTDLSLDSLLDIKIRDFNWKNDPSQKLTHGVIAQELFEVYPDAVMVPEEEDKYWMVDYSKLTPLVIKSIQDLNLKVDSISTGENSSEITIESVISYLQDSAQKTINGIVTFFEIITDKITTKKLCVEDVCVTKDEFLDLLEQNNIIPVPAENAEEQIPAEEILEPQEELPDEQIEIPTEETPEEIIEEPESVVIQEEQIETAEPSL